MSEVVSRYANDPTILSWQLMNEAEDKQGQGGTCSSTATQTLKAFADDMGSVVKSADSNHLLSIGTMGNGQCGTFGAAYQTVASSPGIDLCEYHDYNAPAAALPGDQWNGLQTRLNQCGALGKPLFVGESGIDASAVGGVQNRASLFQAKMNAQFGAGVVGFLPWEWRSAGQTGGDQFVVDPNDPLLGALGTYGMVIAGGSSARRLAGQQPPRDTRR